MWRVFDPVALDPYYFEMARHPRVLDAVEDLIGPSIQLHNSNMHLKLPEHGGEVDWHQDFPYLPHTNFDLLNTMIMLDDSTPENGCLNVIPGSHRWGPLGHGSPGAAASTNFALSAAQRAVGQPVDDVVVPAGGMSIHHCLTLHSSRPEPLAQGPPGLDLHVPGGGRRAARGPHELRRLRDAASRRESVPSPARGGRPRPAAREHGSPSQEGRYRVMPEEGAMRRIRQVSALLVGLALVGLATGDHALAQADKKTIKIGMLQMLTGDLARYGIPLRDAGLYAVEELNAAGGINGRKVEVLLEDVGSTPQGSVQAALKLIQRDRVDVLMQGGTSGHTLATIPVADEHKIVMANMSTAENITQQGSKWTFRVARVPNSILDRKFAQYVAKEMKLQRVAVLYGNDEMGRDAATIFVKALEAQGLKPVAVEQVQVGDPDVSAQVTRVKAANPQAIFVQGHSNEATKIIRTIRQLIPGQRHHPRLRPDDDEQVHRGERRRGEPGGHDLPHRHPGGAVGRQGPPGLRREVEGALPELRHAAAHDPVRGDAGAVRGPPPGRGTT